MATRHPEPYRRMLARLREARVAAGLSQEGVAAAIGARQKYVSKVETGERRIDPCELRELAALYGKPMEYFLDGAAGLSKAGASSPARRRAGERAPGPAGGAGAARWRKPRSAAGPARGKAAGKRRQDDEDR